MWFAFRPYVPVARRRAQAAREVEKRRKKGQDITPVLIGGGISFIGNVVYSNIGIANNVPFAAALALIPIGIMAVYLIGARRLGAFEAL